MLGPSTVAWLGALCVGPAAPAPAVAPQVKIEWSAPAGCPAEDAVQLRLTRALAASAVDPRGLRARASVSEDAAHVLTLALELDREDGPVGRRTLQASDCDELATAAVLIVALAVDPSARVEEEPPQEEPTVPPEPASIDEPATLDEPATIIDEPATIIEAATLDEPVVTPRPPALHIGLQLGAGAGLSVLPGPTAAIAAAVTAWGRAWRAQLGVHYWTPVETHPGGGGAGGLIQQWTIDARGCGLLRPGPLELPLCAGLDVGAVHGKGVGVASPQQVASLRLAFAAGGALVWRPRRWNQRVGPWIGADVLLALVRARFRATPAAPGLVYHTPRVGGRVSAGIELRFR